MDKIICIMLAGGKGKQYLMLNDKPVLYYSLKAFEPYVDEIIIVAAKGEEKYCYKEIVEKYAVNKVSKIVTGGAERYLSVYEGLKAVESESLTESRYVLIHDGARPFVDKEIIERVICKVKECKACIAAVPSKDTVKTVDEKGIVLNTPDRRNIWLVQTPQAFEAGAIKTAYEKALMSGRNDITDDAMVMESFGEYKVNIVMGAYDNIKLTTPEDMLYGMAIIKGKMGI